MALSSDQLRIIVISLTTASARRRLMSAQLEWPGMPLFEILPAVDGRSLTPEQLGALYDEAAAMRHQRPLTPPEIGCAASHLQAYRRILENDLPAALVLEDDALLGHQFLKLIGPLLATLDPARAQIVLLSHVGRYYGWRSRRLGKLHRLVRPYSAYGAHAYLITQTAAREMLAALPPIHTVADDWHYIQRLGRIELHAVVPYLVGTIPAASDSQIGDLRFFLPSRRSALQRWVRKYLWQKLLFQIVVKPLWRITKQESSW